MSTARCEMKTRGVLIRALERGSASSLLYLVGIHPRFIGTRDFVHGILVPLFPFADVDVEKATMTVAEFFCFADFEEIDRNAILLPYFLQILLF